jgi:hypothetical protein
MYILSFRDIHISVRRTSSSGGFLLMEPTLEEVSEESIWLEQKSTEELEGTGVFLINSPSKLDTLPINRRPMLHSPSLPNMSREARLVLHTTPMSTAASSDREEVEMSEMHAWGRTEILEITHSSTLANECVRERECVCVCVCACVCMCLCLCVCACVRYGSVLFNMWKQSCNTDTTQFAILVYRCPLVIWLALTHAYRHTCMHSSS